jgi:hypothetical protein
MREITVNYDGSYPTLCFGTWHITIDDIPIDTTGFTEMNTFGTYGSWYFENWQEVFEDYDDGLDFYNWIKSSIGQLVLFRIKNKGIDLTENEQLDLFTKIQKHDWRYSSCGGCI